MASLLIDTNIFLRHLLQDHADHSPRATTFISRIENREILAETSVAILAEVVFVLERTHKRPKDLIRRGLLELMALPGLAVPGGDMVRDALELYVAKNISYTDAFNAVQMLRRGIIQIVSFDKDFDRVPGLERVEP